MQTKTRVQDIVKSPSSSSRLLTNTGQVALVVNLHAHVKLVHFHFADHVPVFDHVALRFPPPSEVACFACLTYVRQN